MVLRGLKYFQVFSVTFTFLLPHFKHVTVSLCKGSPMIRTNFTLNPMIASWNDLLNVLLHCATNLKRHRALGPGDECGRPVGHFW